MDTVPYKNKAMQCCTCKNHISGTVTCKAFPKRIPLEILSGRFDHSLPHPQDNGIQYEPKPDRTPYYPPNPQNR